MYKHDSRQIAFHDKPFLFGGLPLNSDNHWVKLTVSLVVSLVEGYAEVTTQSPLLPSPWHSSKRSTSRFGECKCRDRLGLVKTKLQETSETQIHLAFLVMNLQKILRDLFLFILSVRFLETRRQILAKTA
jgi:hypothetical protein